MQRTKSLKLYSILRRNARMRQLFEEIRLQESLLKEVRASLPETLGRHVRNLRFKQNRLLLFTDAPVWAARLRLSLPVLLKRLQRRHAAILSLDVRVRAEVRARAPSPRRAIGARAAESIATTADNITDPALAEALRRLCRHRAPRKPET